MREVQGVAADLKQAGLPDIAQALEQALEHARECVGFVVSRFGSAPQEVAAGSVPFLKLMGILLGGWQLGRAALVSQRSLDDSASDFHHAKLTTARFYAAHLLPQVSGLATAVLAGAPSALELPEAAF